ncbi:MAG: HAMP domain-containing histidine kinase [Clostridia bacterium]|nr:HAMP domain-containing histidine kinase [Clostridia bacterium]
MNKKNLTKRILLQLVIYTTAYLALILALDYVFNGVAIDWLDAYLPRAFFSLFYPNTTGAAAIIYAIGVAVIAVFGALRADRIIKKANTALDREETKYPEELKPLGEKLAELKRDIKRNEQARSFAEQQKNDLIVYLAHDLKTPLTSVIGYLSLLEESPELPPEYRAKYAGIALEKAYRLEQLINEFFEITRLNLQSVPLQKSNINLSVLLLQLVNEFYPMSEAKGMTISCNIPSDIKIYGDADKLARVFDNLLRNAVSYGYTNTPIDIAAIINDDCTVVRIRNHSDEIPKEKLEHIFDKFVRLDSSRHSETGGAGLGLAIAKQITELHGGNIAVTSKDCRTDFLVSFPLIKS